MTLHIAEGHDLFSSLESRSTMAEELGRHQAAITAVSVRVRPLDAMLAEVNAGPIDFVSIDVEGHEIAVLRGFDLNRWRPRVMLIEDKSDLNVTEVERHMSERGYRRFYRSGGNDWYVSTESIGPYFIIRMILGGQADWRGFLKVWMPRSLVRLMLIFRRSLLS